MISDDWEMIYKLPFLSTIESKLRALQLKINHNIYTNEKLFMVGKSDTPLCAFCKETIETVEHLFVTCTYVTDLWNLVCGVLNKTHSITALSTTDKILGLYHKIDKTEYDIVNHVMITVKHYIHICKHKDTHPSRNGLLEKIHDTAQTEKRIALKRDKLDLHDRKWNFFLSELPEYP